MISETISSKCKTSQVPVFFSQLIKGKRPLWQAFALLLFFQYIYLDALSIFLSYYDTYPGNLMAAINTAVWMVLLISTWLCAPNVKRWTLMTFAARTYVMYIFVFVATTQLEVLI